LNPCLQKGWGDHWDAYRKENGISLDTEKPRSDDEKKKYKTVLEKARKDFRPAGEFDWLRKATSEMGNLKHTLKTKMRSDPTNSRMLARSKIHSTSKHEFDNNKERLDDEERLSQVQASSKKRMAAREQMDGHCESLLQEKCREVDEFYKPIMELPSGGFPLTGSFYRLTSRLHKWKSRYYTIDEKGKLTYTNSKKWNQ